MLLNPTNAIKPGHYGNKELPQTFQWENLLSPSNLIKVSTSKLYQKFIS